MSLLPLVIDYYEPWQCRHGRRQPELDILGELDMFPSIPDILSLAPRRNELRRVAAPSGRDLPTPIVGKDGFKVLMDVKQFKPEEVVVKTVDNHIVVEGKHDEREDEHGHIYRHFTRKYILPKGYDAKEVTSTLSSDGVLTIKAPPPPKKQIEGNERVIEIQQVGPARGGTNGETEKEQEPMQVENGK